MHEWALAESVIKSAVEYAGAEKFRLLKEAGVVFGELQAIDKEIFVFAPLKRCVSALAETTSCVCGTGKRTNERIP